MGRGRPIRLLDLDPDLATELSAAERTEALAALVAPTVFLEEGVWHIASLCDATGVARVSDIHGFIVVDGLITMRMDLFDRVCVRPMFAADLVLLDGSPSDVIPLTWEWGAVERSRVAVLDRRLWKLAHRWTGVAAALTRRAALQARQAQMHQAISQLPRVEDRLLALLWSFADRRGSVRHEGVWLPLVMTHETLAHMIGGRRPTVSLGLTRLGESGMIAGGDEGWLLTHESLRVLQDAARSAWRGARASRDTDQDEAAAD